MGHIITCTMAAWPILALADNKSCTTGSAGPKRCLIGSSPQIGREVEVVFSPREYQVSSQNSSHIHISYLRIIAIPTRTVTTKCHSSHALVLKLS